MSVALLIDVSGSMSTLRWVARTQERTFSDQQVRDSVLSGLFPAVQAVGAVSARVAVAVVDESQAMLMRQDDADRAAVRPDRALRWIAAATGGGYFADAVLRGAPERADPAGLVRRAIDGHRRAYTLTLTVPATGGPQTLKVAVRGDDLVVRAPAFIPAR